jgi:hypothetical protein
VQLQLKRKVSPEERKLQVAEKKFYDQYNAFERRQFTIDDVWERRELRDELFLLFDEYYDLKDEHRVETNKRNLVLAEGIEDDHEARYQDYIISKEGAHEFERRVLKEIFAILKQRYPPKETQSVSHAKRVSAIIEGEVKILKIEKMDEAARAKADNATLVDPLNPKIADLSLVIANDLTIEKAFAKMTAKKSDFTAVHEKVT